MNPFARLSDNNWVLPVSFLSLILGFMMMMAWMTRDARQTRMSLLSPDQQSRIGWGSIDLQEEYTRTADEVGRLRDQLTKLQNALGEQDSQSKLLNDSLQDAKVFAGLTEVTGAGVAVTLRDSPRADPALAASDEIIHDKDVLRVVNELWNAGAEAIGVNGHRVVASTSFRCVGSVILVNNVQIASPVVVHAIGDPKTLLGALNMPGNVIAEIRETEPSMVQIEEVKKVRLPAFAGSTARKHLTIPSETKETE
jgi:uncharacterized protein YlxW (UPF0749 family)